MGIPLCRYNVKKSDLGCGTKKNVRLEKNGAKRMRYKKNVLPLPLHEEYVKS